jgi:hypothetical protein
MNRANYGSSPGDGEGYFPRRSKSADLKVLENLGCAISELVEI